MLVVTNDTLHPLRTYAGAAESRRARRPSVPCEVCAAGGAVSLRKGGTAELFPDAASVRAGRRVPRQPDEQRQRHRAIDPIQRQSAGEKFQIELYFGSDRRAARGQAAHHNPGGRPGCRCPISLHPYGSPHPDLYSSFTSHPCSYRHQRGQPGEEVRTSGGDRIFPKGLPVGTVTKVGNGADLFLNIRVRPAANLSKLEEAGYVEVEKSFKGRRPNTALRLTRQGREAFREYVRTMNSAGTAVTTAVKEAKMAVTGAMQKPEVKEAAVCTASPAHKFVFAVPLTTQPP